MSFKAIYTGAHEHPSKPAVIHNGSVISYAAFANAIASTRKHFAEQGLPEGKNVVVTVHNLADCWTATLALQALNLNTVCISTTNIPGFLRFLGIQDIAGIVTTEQEASRYQLRPGTIGDHKIIQFPKPVYDNETPGPYPVSTTYQSVGDHILYTSGTTGNYKKIVSTADQQEKRNAERIQQMSLDEETVFHCFDFGLWTSVGYMLPPSCWEAKGCVIFDQRPGWHKHFLQSGVTRAVVLPDQLDKLFTSFSAPAGPSPLENLTLHASGGFISRKLAEQTLSHLTRNLVISYGSTEVPIALLESSVTDLDDLHWLAPTGIRTVEVIDETGAICPVDVEGELRIKLEEQDCSSYLDDPDSSQEVFRDGFFYPGDMAIRRADGRIRILGRTSDVVNFQGQKYAASPIENYIQNFLAVKAACVFSGINEADEDEVIIAIESGQWPDKSRLNHLGHEFDQFEQVRFAKIQPFPRTKTGTGKIDRVALRKLLFNKN